MIKGKTDRGNRMRVGGRASEEIKEVEEMGDGQPIPFSNVRLSKIIVRGRPKYKQSFT